MHNPGKIFQIIGGLRKDNYAIAYDREQKWEFIQRNKLYAHFFKDVTCQKPLTEIGETPNGLIDAKNLQFIGYVD